MRWQVLSRRLPQSRYGRAAAVGGAVVVLALIATGFFDPTSFLITICGPLVVAWATFPRERLDAAWRAVEAALEDDGDHEALIGSMRRLARARRVDGVLGLERAARRESGDVLRRAVDLSLECEDEAELRDLLLADARRRAAGGEEARQVVVTLGKLFPAFGLIGTLIGLGLLLRNLDGTDMQSLGPGLALAVLTTLYGAVLANVFVLPVATKMQEHLGREALRTQMTIDGVLMIQRGEYPTRVERGLRAYVGDASTPKGPRRDAVPLRASEHAA